MIATPVLQTHCLVLNGGTVGTVETHRHHPRTAVELYPRNAERWGGAAVDLIDARAVGQTPTARLAGRERISKVAVDNGSRDARRDAAVGLPVARPAKGNPATIGPRTVSQQVETLPAGRVAVANGRGYTKDTTRWRSATTANTNAVVGEITVSAALNADSVVAADEVNCGVGIGVGSPGSRAGSIHGYGRSIDHEHNAGLRIT